MNARRRRHPIPIAAATVAALLVPAWPVAGQDDAGPGAPPASASRASAPSPAPVFAQPTISPDRSEIAFGHAGDLWSVPAAGGDARLLVAHGAEESRPLYAPDGARLAFMSDRAGSDDLYVLELRTGEVVRITHSDGAEHLDGWSADGEWLYFSSVEQEADGLYDVFRVRAAGGTPMPVAADRYAAEFTSAPSPDGTVLAVAGHGRMSFPQWWRNGHSHIDESGIWLVSGFEESAPRYRPLTQAGSKHLWPMWIAGGVAYMSDRSGAENLWVQPTDGGAARPLTEFGDGRVLWPSASADGRTIVFERDFGIWRVEVTGGGPRAVDIRLRGAAQAPVVEHRRIDDDFSELALSPDGLKIAVVARGEIFAAPAEEGGPAFRVTNTVAAESEPAWAPDSRRLAYVSRRDGMPSIWIHDFVDRTETRLTDGERPATTPVFSPDGTRLAFVRDGRELVVRDLERGAERVVARAQLWRDPFTLERPLAWSPDGRWLAFLATDGRMFTNVRVAPADGSAPDLAASRLANSFAGSLAWTPDGRSIYFDTQHRTEDGQIARVDLVPRTPVFRESIFRELFEDPARPEGEEEPPETARATSPGDSVTRIDPAGIFRRLSLLPLGVDANTLTLSPDGKTLAFTAQAEGQSNIYTFPLDELGDEPAVAQQVTSTPGGKSTPWFTPDGETLVFLDRGRVTRVPLEGGAAKRVDVAAELDVDFDALRMEVFEQGWSYLRDHFYDPAMHGVDWNAVREVFAPRIAGARTPAELDRLMDMMVGELNASHLGYGAPDDDGPRAETGRLGLRFDPQEYWRTGRLRIARVLPLGPAHVGAATAGDADGGPGAGDPRARSRGIPEGLGSAEAIALLEGAYLLAVDGRPITPSTSLDALLAHTVGDRVELRIGRRADGADAFTLPVRPVSTGAEKELVYRDWVNRKRSYVDRVSDGRIGYVHIPDMSWGSLQQLIVDLDAENFGRDGVIIDIRNNNGGFVNAYALDVFARQGYLTMQIRGYPAVPARSMLGQRALEAPTALVINQNSLSDAEDFTEGYRSLGLGPVVGEPTAGWIIYTWGLRLVDGGSFRMPRSMIRDADGEIMELSPRQPSIRVQRPLGESYGPRDAQLDAAVRALLGEAADPSGAGARP